MMKKSLLLLAALMLGGCATHWPETAMLNPQVIRDHAAQFTEERYAQSLYDAVDELAKR